MFTARVIRCLAPVARQCRAAPSSTRSMATYYLKSHEYIQIEGDVGTVGITDFAQNSLGDIVYVELPEIDDVFEAAEGFGSVESVKAASDIYMPLAGTVIDTNTELDGNPGLVNESPDMEGWLIKVKLDDASAVGDLLDGAAYKDLCDAEEH